MAKTASKKRKVVVESIGEAHITASFNNIIISSNQYQRRSNLLVIGGKDGL